MPVKDAKIRDYRDVVENVEIAWIPMKDGRRLAARLLLPKDPKDRPVPAILEYIPYRRRDGTRPRDDETHYWFAANGYGVARVDIAGSGDSDGLVQDEYHKREQDDALEIIAWLAKQPWCTGNVGMIGISWGGFNGLQVAARRPPALKAVISLCSTVDRYADDVHFMGGCLLNDTLDWGGYFFTIGALPPDPEIVGKERWRELWKHRIDNMDCYPMLWMEHQRRDAFWKHGSVCENYDAIAMPGADGQRLGRWLYRGGVPQCREPERPGEGYCRPVGSQISAYRRSGSGHRLPAGMQALVGSLAEGQADGRRERSAIAAMAAGLQNRPSRISTSARAGGSACREWPSKNVKTEKLYLGDGTLDGQARHGETEIGSARHSPPV